MGRCMDEWEGVWMNGKVYGCMDKLMMIFEKKDCIAVFLW
jgi:hypothetical protein